MNKYLVVLSISVLVLVILFTPDNYGNLRDKILAGGQEEENTSQQPSGRQVEASSVASSAPIASEEISPELNLKSAVALNLSNHFYFLNINSNHRWPMASLTKLLTAVVALEAFNEFPETSKLVKQMMVVSHNSAAEQLAELGGDRQQFIEMMQIKADLLGMSQTSIFEPTGLSFLNQSTAGDLEKLIIYITQNHPSILQLSRQKEVEIDGEVRGNINRFAGRSDFLGGKTGYTDEASGNLISIFQYQGQPVVVIVLGAAGYEERFDQTELILQWISKTYN